MSSSYQYQTRERQRNKNVHGENRVRPSSGNPRLGSHEVRERRTRTEDVHTAQEMSDRQGIDRFMERRGPGDVSQDSFGEGAAGEATGQSDSAGKLSVVVNMIPQFQTAVADLVSELKKDQQRIAELERTNKRTEESRSYSGGKEAEQRDEVKRLLQDKETLRQEIKLLEDKLEEVKGAYQKLESFKEKAVSVIKKAEVENKDLVDERHGLEEELKNQRGRVKALQEQLNKMEKEKQDALTRLSRQMGNQLSDGNANITDLSDRDRPTKLGERFNEMYDNQWTEALEALQKLGLEDEKIILILLDVLKDCFSYGSRMAEEQLHSLKYQFGLENVQEDDLTMQEKEAMKAIKDARKVMKSRMMPRVYKEFYRDYSRGHSKSSKYAYAIEAYVKDCFELSWLMALCDPPLDIGVAAKGSSLDTNFYRPYTVTGSTIDYVVWPVLFLHKDGPIVSKGVAQPYKESRRAKSAPARAWEKNKTPDMLITTTATSSPMSRSTYGVSMAQTMTPQYSVVSAQPSYQQMTTPTSVQTQSQYYNRPANDNPMDPYSQTEAMAASSRHLGFTQQQSAPDTGGHRYPTQGELNEYLGWQRIGKEGDNYAKTKMGESYYVCKAYLEKQHGQ